MHRLGDISSGTQLVESQCLDDQLSEILPDAHDLLTRLTLAAQEGQISEAERLCEEVTTGLDTARRIVETLEQARALCGEG